MERKENDLEFNYANNVLMFPLIKIGGHIGLSRYETALRFERTIILSLLPEWKKEFDKELDDLNYILDQSDLFLELDPVQFEIKRKAYFKKVGSKVALKIYDKIWSFVHGKYVFENLDKQGTFVDPARGRKSFRRRA